MRPETGAAETAFVEQVSIHASVKDATPYMTAGTKAKAFQSTHL